MTNRIASSVIILGIWAHTFPLIVVCEITVSSFVAATDVTFSGVLRTSVTRTARECVVNCVTGSTVCGSVKCASVSYQSSTNTCRFHAKQPESDQIAEIGSVLYYEEDVTRKFEQSLT